ncbi:MAG: BamA/TamA family outer membrane protein [Elusimicrobiales bacterium]
MKFLSAALAVAFMAGPARAEYFEPSLPQILAEKNTPLMLEQISAEYQKKLMAPYAQPEPEDLRPKNFAEKIFSKIVIPLRPGPLLLLPVVDSSRDLGPNYGLMPIWALRDEKRKAISSVLAPSVNYNQYLRTTFTYRHYFFPDDVQLWVARLSYSEIVQRELFLRYSNPAFMGTRWRVNAEMRHWINGKASFYGTGPESTEDGKATFALEKTGGEFTISAPMPANLYADFTESYYQYKTSQGPVPTLPQLKDKYPAIYSQTSDMRDFLIQRLSLFYDDTDHPVIPKRGTYAAASAAFSRHGVASDYSYNYYSAEMKHYFNYRGQGKQVTAVHALIENVKGQDTLPFYAMPTLGESTGLRAVGDGRFVDAGKIVFNIEQRVTPWKVSVMNFFSEFEFTPFIDVGTVYSTLGRVQPKQFSVGYGGAFRIVIRPQVVATADFAFSKEGTNVIIHVGYPF